MESLALGIVAAIAWGIHDLCVRQVSQRTGIFSSLVTVLFFGSLLSVPTSLIAETAPTAPNAFGLSIASGAFFGLGAIALYKAFAIGPVRLVAPIIGAYPVLSVGWAVLQGSPVTLWQSVAVLIVIAGVGYVAASVDDKAIGAKKGIAVLWSVVAGIGFALTFALGQAASSQGGELALIGPTRVAALLTVLIIALIVRAPVWPERGQLHVLLIMGVLDAIALGSVISSGQLTNPEFASVAASTFGLITLVLAAAFLGERLKRNQWLAVTSVFAAIAFLGL